MSNILTPSRQLVNQQGQTLTFENTLLAGSGKRGVLKPMDDSGYYMMNAGKLNAPLRLGHAYAVNDYVMECMDPNSDLMRRVARGEVYAELGHPQPFYLERVNGMVVRTPITEAFEWVMRLRTIVMDNVCLHIRRIHFDMMGGRYDPVMMRAEIIPFGTHKQLAQDSLTNPDINTALSMRTVTAPQKMGDKTRFIEYFCNFDLVFEPGAAEACKHLTAGLEDLLSGMGNSFDPASAGSISFTVDTLVDAWETHRNNPDVIARFAGMESFNDMDNVIATIKRNSKGSKVVTAVNTGCFDLF